MSLLDNAGFDAMLGVIGAAAATLFGTFLRIKYVERRQATTAQRQAEEQSDNDRVKLIIEGFQKLIETANESLASEQKFRLEERPRLISEIAALRDELHEVNRKFTAMKEEFEEIHDYLKSAGITPPGRHQKFAAAVRTTENDG